MPKALHVFPSLALGGSQARLLALARHWGGRVTHAAISMDGRWDALDRLPAEVQFKRIPFDTIRGRGLANRAALRSVVQREQPDCVLTYNFGAIEGAFANWPRLARHIHVEDGFGPDEVARRLPRRSLTRWAGMRLAGATLLVPSLTLHRIAREEWHVSPRHLVYVPNGVATPDATATAAANQRDESWAAGRLVLGIVGGLRPEKRVDRFIDVLAQLPEAVALVAGDGALRETLQAKAEGLGIDDRIRWLGQVEDPSQVYRAIDVLVLTSDTEQLPMVVLEAMAHGLPVVSTDVGDVADIVAQTNRPYVVERDVAALAAAIREIAADAGKRASIGVDNRRHVGVHYAFDTMASAWFDLMFGAGR